MYKHRILLEKLIFCLNICLICAEAAGEGIRASRMAPDWIVRGTNGDFQFNTNTAVFWRGAWKEDTNGWRVQLNFWDPKIPSQFAVEVGSTVRNEGGGYFSSPTGKFSKFELVDSHGIMVPCKKGLSMEKELPPKMPLRVFPKWPDGEIKGTFGFRSNSPPSLVAKCLLNYIYAIKNEDDYTLTVCPVLYRYGTNEGYLERLDLPCVTIKIHLKPSE